MSSKKGIVACVRCKSRKIRCDKAMPKCTNCEKSGRPCVTIDPASGRKVPRSYLNHLETRIKHLELELESLSHTKQSVSGYSGWASESSKKDDARELPVDLPTKSEAEKLIQLFFERCNSMCPILHREQFIQQCFEPVYGPIGPDLQLCSNFSSLSVKRSSAEPETGTFYRRWVDCGNSMTAAPEPHMQSCLHFLFMVFALAAATTHYGSVAGSDYLGAAMLFHPAVANERAGLEHQFRSIQATLLISLCGLTLQTIPSAWFSIGSAMRLCIDLDFHNEKDVLTESSMDGFDQDMRRRLFWTAFLLDRAVSIRLGKPVNIEEGYINCPLPSMIDDSWLTFARRQLSTVGNTSVGAGSTFQPPDRPSYKWVFHSILQLLKIQARARFLLYDQTSVEEDTDRLRALRDGLAADLEVWRDSISWDPVLFNFDWNTDIFEASYLYTRVLMYGKSRAIPFLNIEERRILLGSADEMLRIYAKLASSHYAVQPCALTYNAVETAISFLTVLSDQQEPLEYSLDVVADTMVEVLEIINNVSSSFQARSTVESIKTLRKLIEEKFRPLLTRELQRKFQRPLEDDGGSHIFEFSLDSPPE